MQLANIRKTCFALAVGTLCAGAQAGVVTNHTVSYWGAATANNETLYYDSDNGAGMDLGYGELSGAQSSVNFGDQGAFSAIAGGWGKFSSTASITNSLTFTNDGSSASAFTLRLMLNRANAFVEMDGGIGGADLKLDIKVDGNSIYDKYASFNYDGTFYQNLSGDLEIRNWEETGYNGLKKARFQWSDTYIDIDLGILDANQSVEINYDFLATAYGDYTQGIACYGFTYGCGTGIGPGDPFGVNEGPAFEILARDPQPPSGVPEPASIWLGVTGLIGLAAMRRRKRPT